MLSCAYEKEQWPEVQLVVGVGDKVVGHTAPYLVQWTNDVSKPAYIAQGHIEMVKVKEWGKCRFLDILEQQLS